ncbi:MAG: TRAP transporter small permease [Planctomycetota bacterium]|jgi:TRAP-type C4-dicarboxylate transport system permease small subunit|nr:TRAP transporter small permease [Planctomycetota bacterium]
MWLLRRFNAITLKVASWTVILSMAAMAMVVPYEVFGRYVLGNMSMWGSEFLQYSLVWASMLGGAVGLRRGYQVGITSLTDSLPPGAARFVQAVSHVAMLAFLAFVTYYGFDQVAMNRSQVSSTLGIPMSIPYAALPIGFLIMFFVTMEQLVDFLSAKPTGNEK